MLPAQQSLNNDAVVKLTKAGLSDDLVVSTVNSQPGSYDTSTDGMIALKKAGVSDRVVAALVARSSASPAPQVQLVSPFGLPVAAANVGANSDDPAAPHEAGIYIFNDDAPAGSKMTMLEPSNYTQGKTGGMFVSQITYGIAKVKFKAVLRGGHANARVSVPQPTFYFYFEEQSAGLSHASTAMFGGTSTPNEYTLLKFDVKGESRETVIGEANAFGRSGGTDDKAVTSFTYSKLKPGVYKVMLNAALQPGEYGFISGSQNTAMAAYGAVGAGNNRVFDFGRH
jgi:hypothetical protein